jgi:hypothetical protein
MSTAKDGIWLDLSYEFLEWLKTYARLDILMQAFVSDVVRSLIFIQNRPHGIIDLLEFSILETRSSLGGLPINLCAVQSVKSLVLSMTINEKQYRPTVHMLSV